MQMSDFKTSTRLVTAFVLVALIGALTGGVAVHNMGRLNEANARLYDQELLGVSLMKEANVERLRSVVALRDAMIATTAPERAAAVQRIASARAKVPELIGQADSRFDSPESRAALEQLQTAWRQDEAATQDMLKRIQAAELGAPSDMLSYLKASVVPPSIVLGNAMGELSQRKEQDARAASVDNGRLHASARQWTLLLVLLGIAAGVALGVGISRQVTRPLARAVDSAQRMSQGDMSQALQSQGSDEAAQLLQALERMRARLQETVSAVRDNAGHVALASAEIAKGNADLSQRTEAQASALQQTTASMDELDSTARTNADNALQADRLAQSASQVAVRGGEVVAEVVQTMQGINESSRRIADIVGTIDSIAFQTNILALNAAVEAARAGEQGRGFAVVAGEVRSLAQLSAEAAKEIKQLIGASVERVEQGSAQVSRAGQTMDELVVSMRRVTDIVAEISSASHEQSAGVSQVGQAIAQMDQVTQQNAALVEQSAAAAAGLQQQADHLVQVVHFFRLER